MQPEHRRQQIVTALGARGMVRADDLATTLGVSLETIRRDLNELERRGELNRVYGGATRAPHTEILPYERRRQENADAKRAIGRYAAGLVRPRQTVFYDVGTTAVEVARALPSDLVGQAVTNSGHAADELAKRAGLRVQKLDGTVREGERAASGPAVESAFAASYADVAFLSAGGVHPFSGVTDYFPDEIRVKTLMLNRSLVRYVLAESAKLGRVAAHRVCDLSAVTAVITDWKMSRDMLDAFTRRGVRVHQAPPVEAAG